MAGIGFELKKIYRKEGISNTLMGTVYSFAITVGPTVIVITTILLLYYFLDMTRISIADRELLSSTILYVFIFSGILCSPFNSIFSRYMADKFFFEKMEDILPAYYSGLILISFLSLIMAIPVLCSMYFRGHVDLAFLTGAFFLWCSTVILFYSSTFLQGTKDYKIIALFYLIAMIIGGLTAWFLYRNTFWDQIHCILYGLTLGFFIIAFCEFAYIKYYFHVNSGNYRECLQYFKKYYRVVLTNFFYTLGLYTHNFVMWHNPDRIIVAETLVSHQAYDMATCLAMFTNISATVIFTVVAETEFHEVYQKYMESIYGGTYRLIRKNKKVMFQTLYTHLGQIFSMQVAITSLVFLFLHIFGMSMGFSSLTMNIYTMLTIAYLGVFMMYSMIVFLYYFEDTVGSVTTSFLFLICTTAGTLFSRKLYPTFYGLGLLIGILVAFVYAYLRLRILERNFEKHIFCRCSVVDTKKAFDKNVFVYKNGRQK